MRTSFWRAVLLVVLVMPTLAQAGSYLRVVSWNLRHEGWADERTYADDAKQIWQRFGSNSNSTNGCDLVFLQEVMDTSAAASIASELTRVSGVAWSYAVTPLLGRSSYKEAYAVLYRTGTVTLLSSTVHSDPGDVFEREPQIVKVRLNATGEDFTFINWHAVWGTTAERQAELNAIDAVFNSVQNASSTDQDVILVGDHNADCTSSMWNGFKARISPAVSCRLNVATTLNTNGEFANAYDHFWMQNAYVTEFSNAGRDYIGDTKDFATRLSDHAPVWLRLYSSGSTD